MFMIFDHSNCLFRDEDVIYVSSGECFTGKKTESRIAVKDMV